MPTRHLTKFKSHVTGCKPQTTLYRWCSSSTLHPAFRYSSKTWQGWNSRVVLWSPLSRGRLSMEDEVGELRGDKEAGSTPNMQVAEGKTKTQSPRSRCRQVWCLPRPLWLGLHPPPSLWVLKVVLLSTHTSSPYNVSYKEGVSSSPYKDEEPTHWKRPWCWERLKAGREGLNGITNQIDMSLSKFQEIVKDREAGRAAVHGVTKSSTLLNKNKDTSLIGLGPHPYDLGIPWWFRW